MAATVLEVGGGSFIVHDTSVVKTPVKDPMGGPVRLKHITAKNADASDAILLLYDSTSPTVHTTEPIEVLKIDGTGGGTNSGHMSTEVNPQPAGSSTKSGIKFSTALSYAATTIAGWQAGSAVDPTSAVSVDLTVEKES